MDQTKYLQQILEKCEMMECKPRATPCEIKPSSYSTDDDTIIDKKKMVRIMTVRDKGTPTTPTIMELLVLCKSS